MHIVVVTYILSTIVEETLYLLISSCLNQKWLLSEMAAVVKAYKGEGMKRPYIINQKEEIRFEEM